MNCRLLILCLVASLGAGACKKLPEMFSRDAAPEATPAPLPVAAVTPTPAPTPTPTPEPTPVAKAPIDETAQVIVLCYHRFENPARDSLAITPEEFERQLNQIQSQGIEVIPMERFLAWRRGEENIPKKSAVITIDDGYESGYSVAWPLLKKFGYPFTMYIYTNYVNAGGKSITWDQLAEMRDAGVDIASHTISHSDLRGKKGKTEAQYLDWLREEIISSKNRIEKELAIRVTTLAYPYGRYNDEVRKIVAEAGYEAAFSVYGQKLIHSSPSDILGRYAVESTKPQVFQAAIGFGGGVSGGASATTARADAQTLQTEPRDGATISEQKPLLKANLASLGNIDPASVQMRISGFGLVPAKFDPATQEVTYKMSQRLRDKTYTVILSASVKGGKKAETRWSFNYDPSAPAGAESHDGHDHGTPAAAAATP